MRRKEYPHRKGHSAFNFRGPHVRSLISTLFNCCQLLTRTGKAAVDEWIIAASLIDVRAWQIGSAPQGLPFGTSELAKFVADCADFKWREFDALLSQTRTSAPVFASQNLFHRVVKA